MDRKTFPDFYRANVKRVYRYLFYRVGADKAQAEDLTQDVFLKAFKAFDSYDPNISQASWIFTIARNHFINHLEKQRPGVALEDIENTNWDKVDIPDKLATRHDEQRLLAAIDRLPKDDAELIRAKYLEGWGYDDIAERLGKSSVALRVQAHRALKAIRTLLKQKGPNTV